MKQNKKAQKMNKSSFLSKRDACLAKKNTSLLIYIFMFFLGGVFSSCNQNEDIFNIELKQDIEEVSFLRGLVSNTNDSRYKSNYTHLRQQGLQCAATNYVLAMNMVVDYAKSNGLSSVSYPISSSQANSIDSYIKKNFSGGASPSVGNLENYFAKVDKRKYRNVNVYKKTFESQSEAEQFIIDNIAYNVIIVPVVVDPSNIGTSNDGSTYASFEEKYHYVVKKSPGREDGRKYWGHYLLLTGGFYENGEFVVTYRDSLESDQKEKTCRLERLVESNRKTSNWSWALLCFQHV